MICTALTVTAAEVDLNQYFSGLNIIVALTIAVFKPSLVVLFFMHANYSPGRTQLVIIPSVFSLAVMLFMNMSDYLTGRWLEPPAATRGTAATPHAIISPPPTPFPVSLGAPARPFSPAPPPLRCPRHRAPAHVRV